MKTSEILKREKNDVKHMRLTTSLLKSEITRTIFVEEYEKQFGISLFEVMFFHLGINNKPMLSLPMSDKEISILDLVNLYNLKHYHSASSDLNLPNKMRVFFSNKVMDMNKYFTES
tara:strand:+ start:514 stop:861 length:348 start_codon:yes stop_codon:yes gene_type:complete